MIETLAERVNGDARLVHRGRFVETTFLLEVGDEAWLVRIEEGRIAEIRRGPFVMPRWTFALRASAEAWGQFWSASPPPGFHDLFALIRFKRLSVEGDMHPFMANLFYFKGVLGSLRGQA
ncbi:hypothetical protein [Enterovirga rhinocerotis]|uniref:SCP-2 sterol transfer family protein n=1 Tax=Enterovirga rhinocerotis TaxID=1339210 RepID=A0A4R7BXB0_9HYPH|nr:hypothetical protein [Enterovirga rhinocerotis]TDR89852.1 hypothetical protein EV668_2688 [Enterovirga rhinocerotis]